jgi:hypothetical protein
MHTRMENKKGDDRLISTALGQACPSSLTCCWCHTSRLSPCLTVRPQLCSVNGVGVHSAAYQVLHHAAQAFKVLHVLLQLTPQLLNLLLLLQQLSGHAYESCAACAVSAGGHLGWQDTSKPNAGGLLLQ